MSREELIEKMLESEYRARTSQELGAAFKDSITWRKWCVGMAAALDVAVGELLGEPTVDEAQAALKEQVEFERTMTERHKYTFTHSIAMRIFGNRRSCYLKPKSDPAVEAAGRAMLAEMDHFGCKNGQVISEVAAKIVAAVRNADKLKGGGA